MCQHKDIHDLTDGPSAPAKLVNASAFAVRPTAPVDPLSGYEPPARSRWGWAILAAAAGVASLVSFAAD